MLFDSFYDSLRNLSGVLHPLINRMRIHMQPTFMISFKCSHASLANIMRLSELDASVGHALICRPNNASDLCAEIKELSKCGWAMGILRSARQFLRNPEHARLLRQIRNRRCAAAVDGRQGPAGREQCIFPANNAFSDREEYTRFETKIHFENNHHHWREIRY